MYFQTGKIFNQIFREGLPLSQAFSSPLLLHFLFGGPKGLLESNLSHSELIQGILDHDSGYAGRLS